jgi:hypothetical protein
MGITRAAKVLLSWAGGGVVGTIATYAILGTVPPSDVRNAVLLLIWPLVIICGTLLGWRWLGRPEENAARNVLTGVIQKGRDLRRTLVRELAADEAEQAAWKVRVGDWVREAERAVDRVAPDRLSAFQADALYTDHPLTRDMPHWMGSLVLELDVRVEQLILLRASL